MNVVYKTVLKRIRDVRAAALKGDREIDYIELSSEEFEQAVSESRLYDFGPHYIRPTTSFMYYGIEIRKEDELNKPFFAKWGTPTPRNYFGSSSV